MSAVNIDFAKLISNDNTRNIKYTLVFFLFFVALSQNIFENLFGCQVKTLLKSIWLRHLFCLFFLFVILDYGSTLNVDDTNPRPNPIHNVGYSVLVYSLILLLLQTNIFYIYFMSIVVIIFIVLDKLKSYYVHSIRDQEILQDRLGFLYKLNNVLLIISILTIIIGTLTSTKTNPFKKIFSMKQKC